jgi:hypothetical protein
VTTDQQGRYSFEGLPEGRYNVFGTFQGFWIRERVVRLGTDTTASLDLEAVVSGEDSGGSPPSMPVRGIVIGADGRPISGARITHSGQARERKTLSASDGRFGFCRMSGASIEFRVEHEDYKPRRISVKAVAGQEIRLKVELQKR